MSIHTQNLDRRSVYRVHPGSPEQLAVAMRTMTGEVAAEEVVDVAITGVATRFPRRRTPAVPNGEKVLLLLKSPALLEPAVVPATVVKGVEMESEWRYSFRFEDTEALIRGASGDLLNLFNRRAAVRGDTPLAPVRPRMTVRVPRAADAGAAHEVELRNLSTTGFRIVAEARLDAELAGVEEAEFTLELPGYAGTIRGGAAVCYRGAAGAEALYGMKFIWPDAGRARSHTEAIREYLSGRDEAAPAPGIH